MLANCTLEEQVTFDWSEQSPHIRTLYRPWQPGDGYDEDVIAAAEEKLGIRLPVTLRSFYASWGRREDMTHLVDHLLPLDKLVVTSGALIFCVENQSCLYWGIGLESLGEVNPPVEVVEPGAEMSVWEVSSDLERARSHETLSDFLDELTYMHVFCGGAIHEAHTANMRPEQRQIDLLEQTWRHATTLPMVRRCPLNIPTRSEFVSPLYVRDAQAISWYQRYSAVARESQALDEIGEELCITWERRR
jgi:hypothetical protein